MIRIVHLSDLHIDKKEIEKFEDYFIPALKKDLSKFILEKQIDFVVFSGDIVDKGGKSFGSLSEGLMYFSNNVIKNLSENTGIPIERFIMVPGNHDINRNADEKYTDDGLLDYLNSEDVIDTFIKSNKKSGIERILEFKKFEEEFYKKSSLKKDLTNFQSSFKFNIDGLNIGITCFNTSWRCYDSDKDKGRLLIGEKQITDSNKFLNGCDVKIAISHHPFDWLATFDMKFCEPAIRNQYNILLCGHVHEGSNWSKTDMYGNIFVSTAPSNWTCNLRSDSRQFSNGYSIIDYDPLNEKIICHSRRYNHIKRSFDPNTDIGDERGIVEYQLPRTEDKKLSKYRYEICDKIINMHKEEINEHLLSSNIQIDAPKDIEELYVKPRIRKKNEMSIDAKKDENIEIDELCNSDINYIIFGERESGKTLLLDKIVIELSKRVIKLNKIPVYFDYNDLGNKRIEQVIKSYLGIGITEVSTLLIQHKIVLLIDNLSYHNCRKLFNLIDFIQKNNIQIIATSTTLLQGKIDPELFSYELFSQCKVVFLELFNNKQIKELVEKWFVKDKIYDNPSKVKKVVNTLLALKLPRTPLAISMFLWIMEQQENAKPKNYAAMLQNFIEKLFEKTSIVDVYSQDFDYTNKIILLTDIAFEMYETGDINYSMPLVDLSKFIQDNLLSKKFDFDYEEVLSDFIYRGIIFVETRNNIKYARFRYNCFFTYMLMNKMDIDPCFYKFVMSEENYLNFVHEIDYFTALKRTRSDILIFVFSRLEEIFNEEIETIEKVELGFDSLHNVGEENLLIDKLEDDIVTIMDNKPRGQEVDNIIDNMHDCALEEASVGSEKSISRKENNFTDFEKMDNILYLATKILKNTEEIKIENLKYESYVKVIRCCMCYNKIFAEWLEQQNLTYKIGEINIDLVKVQNKFAPVINEMILNFNLSSNKLKTVIKEKIESDLKYDNVSDYEKFVSIFLYADMKGENSISYISRFIKNLKQSYLKDMILLKLYWYYIFDSKTKESDKLYTDIIIDLIKKSSKLKRTSKSEMTTFDKGALLKNLQKYKKETLESNSELPLC